MSHSPAPELTPDNTPLNAADILVFGKSGQLAQALAQLIPQAYFAGRAVADLADPARCRALIETRKPRAVINAAAYTAVDQAETEQDLAQRINATSPGVMAQTCAAAAIPFVHVSTDYVFDGAGETPFAPDHPCAPLGSYGRSKRAGEEAIIAAAGTFAILRTSWVFSATGNNFVKTMLRLGATRDALRVVADQIGGPTSAGAIAAACRDIARHLMRDPAARGIYHFAGAPDTSWADFARAIFAQAGLPCRVEDIPSSAYPTPAKRPLNSRLDCTTTEQTFAIARPDWRADLSEVLHALNEAQKEPQP